VPKYYVQWKDIDSYLKGIKFDDDFDLILAIHRGGLPIGTALSHKLDIPLHIGYISRYDNPGHRPFGYIDIDLPEFELEDKKILLVDDISDEGKTLKKMNKLIVRCKPKEIKSLCYVIKTDTKFTPDYYHVIVPQNNWVVFPWEELKNE
jgi:hypothetical protein